MVSKSRAPGLGWLLQRVSALFLVVGLVGHFYVLHYTNLFAGVGVPAAESTRLRFFHSGMFWMVFDGLLLSAGLYHALNGVYNIVSDYNPSLRTRKILAAALWLLGGFLFVVGLVLLGRFFLFARS